MRKTLRFFSQLLTGILLILLPIAVHAQGTVSGLVKDASTQSTLPGAAISIMGTNYGTISDNFGQYTLTGVPEGKVTIVFSYIGYTNNFVEIDMKDGETKKLVIELDVESFGVAEVIITGQLLGQTKAINEQLNADGNVNVVSEEKMKELPDANAAEAIGRISGVSLQRNQGEGQKVVIRGLEPKFSNITINGVKLPSNDPDDRSVDLSMISPEMLQGIEVFKSPTPDMDGEAVGGTVNLRINKAPEKQKFNFKAGSGYNALRKDFGDYLFSGSYSRRFFGNKLGVIVQANAERVNRSSDDIDTRYQQSYLTQPDTGNYTRAFTGDIRITEEIRKRAGVSSNIDLQLDKGYISLYGFYNQTTRDIDQRRSQVREATEIRNYVSRRRYETDVLSVMLNGEYAFGLLKTDGNVSYAKTTNNNPYRYDGEWRITSNVRSDGFEENDDIRYWFNHVNFAQDSIVTRQMEVNMRNLDESNMSAALNLELPLNFGNNWAVSFKMGGKYNQLHRVREYSGFYNSWYYLGVNHGQDFPGAVMDGDYVLSNTFYEDNYAAETINGFAFYNPFSVQKVVDFIDQYNTPENGYIGNFEERADNMDITENLIAGYFMAKIKFSDILTIIPGVRVENSQNTYNSFITEKFSNYEDGQKITPTTNSQEYTEILPHFHLKFEPVDWYKLRFSAAKTLARPNYNYVALSAFVNRAESSNEVTQGNPNLEHMTSMNYDLSMSFYNAKLGLLTIGGFYKDIENIFYENNGYKLFNDSLAAANGWPDFTGITLNSYTNSPEAVVYGFEVDLQTNFKYWPKPFNGIVLSSNFTRIFSETTKYGYTPDQGDPVFNPITFQVEYPNAVNIAVERAMSIPGQVDMIFNIAVGYEFKGTSVRISGTYQADYLDQPQLESSGLNDEYRLEFFRWDLAFKQKITKNIEIYFNASNLTNMTETTLVSNYKFTNPLQVAYPDVIFTGRVFNYGIRVNL